MLRRPFMKPLVAAALVYAGAAGFGALSGPLAAASGYVVQLASLASRETAERHWDLLRSRNPELLGDMELMLEEANLGARGTYYRVQIGPFPNAATAQDMCLQLEAKNQECLVVRR